MPAECQRARIWASCALLPRLYWITASWPVRVGEIAALKMNWLGSEMVPACLSADPGHVTPLQRLGTNSYHRAIDGVPGPSTVCWVQMPFAPAASGSLIPMAWVSRVSLESSTRLLLGCGTLSGNAKLATLKLPSLTRLGDPPPPPPVTCHAMIWLADPRSG